MSCSREEKRSAGYDRTFMRDIVFARSVRHALSAIVEWFVTYKTKSGARRGNIGEIP